jgi:hypothetical protein
VERKPGSTRRAQDPGAPDPGAPDPQLGAGATRAARPGGDGRLRRAGATVMRRAGPQCPAP